MNCHKHEDEELLSGCCGGRAIDELSCYPEGTFGRCGRCKENTEFECDACNYPKELIYNGSV